MLLSFCSMLIWRLNELFTWFRARQFTANLPITFRPEANFTLPVATCLGGKIVCTCPTIHSTAHSHSYSTGAPLRRLWCAKENSFSTFSIAPTHVQKGKVSGIHCAHMSFFYQVVLLNKLKSFLISHQLIKIHQILAKPHNKNACFTFEGSYKILFS